MTALSFELSLALFLSGLHFAKPGWIDEAQYTQDWRNPGGSYIKRVSKSAPANIQLYLSYSQHSESLCGVHGQPRLFPLAIPAIPLSTALCDLLLFNRSWRMVLGGDSKWPLTIERRGLEQEKGHNSCIMNWVIGPKEKAAVTVWSLANRAAHAARC